MAWIWTFSFLTLITVLIYNRASIKVWTLSIGLFLLIATQLANHTTAKTVFYWIAFLAVFIPLNIAALRQKFFSKPFLNFYRKAMPTVSRTEREALAAGTVGWEGDLFRGNPNWEKLLSYPIPKLSTEEQAFFDGPVKTLCSMIDDWDITFERGDLPESMWTYLKEEGFFGLIIPKEYGGKEFSALAHSEILTQVYGRSSTVATTIGVPNSLGPAELLLHYGTTEQKNYYLPRLARGEEIPCFALTGPDAGSDAGAMIDTGIVCWGEYQGKKVLGIRLNWNKRYITLAPVATLIGLAFKLYDPDNLLGTHKELGITCVLIPRDTPGITIGRRHIPTGTVFQNGPIQGHDVFIPVDFIIGGTKMAGQGWRMLMECLAAGRAITLPASSLGGSKVLTYASGAYARIRRQFNVPIGRFEGIEEVVTAIAGFTYVIDATRLFTASIIDLGEKPSVASAITKYHATELGRIVTLHAMDLHGGKAVCVGPLNYIAPSYLTAPVAITVEGANILTRNLIIFGQGAMRCHPYVFAELEAAQNKDPQQSLEKFDKAITGHISFFISNIFRSFILAITGSKMASAPAGKTKHYFQSLTRFSSVFALLSDSAFLIYGANLKRKESISARLGDILSYLYLLSAVLKHYYDQGRHIEDLPIINWSCQTYLQKIQEKIDEILKNIPNRVVSWLLRVIIFPFGMRFSKPSDKLTNKVAQLFMSPTDTRARLASSTYIEATPGNMLAVINDALEKAIAAEPIEKILKAAHLQHLIHGETVLEEAKSAYAKKIISKEQLEIVLQAEEARQKVIAVDDFAPDALMRKKINNSENNVHAKQSES